MSFPFSRNIYTNVMFLVNYETLRWKSCLTMPLWCSSKFNIFKVLSNLSQSTLQRFCNLHYQATVFVVVYSSVRIHSLYSMLITVRRFQMMCWCYVAGSVLKRRAWRHLMEATLVSYFSSGGTCSQLRCNPNLTHLS